MKIINFYSLPLYVPQLTLCEEAATKKDAEEAAKAAGEVDKNTKVSDLNETAAEKKNVHQHV